MSSMLASIRPLSDFDAWARTSALQIVMLVAGAILVSRGVTWASRRITKVIDARSPATDSLVRSEAAKHHHAVTEVVTWSFLGLLYVVTGVLVVQRLDVPLTSLVAPATVIGVALGFGAQRVVQDVLAGFLIVSERQYGFGDLVRITPNSGAMVVTGTVEELTLRITRLRTINGEVVFVPNGQILYATNLSRDWARAVIDVPLPATTDIAAVTAALRQVGKEAVADEATPAAPGSARARLLNARTSPVSREGLKSFRDVVNEVDDLGAASARSAQSARDTRESYGAAPARQFADDEEELAPMQDRLEQRFDRGEAGVFDDDALYPRPLAHGTAQPRQPLQRAATLRLGRCHHY